MPRTRVLAGGIAAGVVALLATAAPASAHDELVSSDPPADTVLDTAPDRVTLTFSGELLDLGAAIVVADADGADQASGTPVLDGHEASVAVNPGLPDAAYEVRWRVVSSDGHPISGVIPFVVGDGDTPEPGAAAAPADDATAPTDDATAPADDPRETAQAGRSGAADAGADDGPGRVLAVGAGGALLALAVLVLVTRTRRRHAAAGPDDAAAAGPASSDSPERH